MASIKDIPNFSEAVANARRTMASEKIIESIETVCKRPDEVYALVRVSRTQVKHLAYLKAAQVQSILGI